MRDDPDPDRPRIMRASELLQSNQQMGPQILRMDANETIDYVSHFEYVKPVSISQAFGRADTFGLLYEGSPNIVDDFVGAPDDDHPDMHFELFPATVDDHWHIGLFETEWGDICCWGIYRGEAAQTLMASIGTNDVFEVGVTFPPETGAPQSCPECEGYSDVGHMNATYSRDISDVSVSSAEETVLRINGQPVLDDEIPTPRTE